MQHSLGSRIRELRMKRGFTQSELCRSICTASMISQIESDRARPSYKILFALAERLEVSIETLLSNSEIDIANKAAHKLLQAMVNGHKHEAALYLCDELLKSQHATITRHELLYLKGRSLYHLKRYDEALLAFTDVQSTLVQPQRVDYERLAQIYSYMGRIYSEQKNLQIAVYHWQKALDLLHAEASSNVELLGALRYQLGVAYTELGQPQEAIQCFGEAVTNLRRAGDLSGLAETYLQVATTYRHNADHEKAARYAELASTTYDLLENVNLKAQAERSLALCHANTGDLTGAIQDLNRLVGVFKRLQQPEEAGVTLVDLSKLYLRNEEYSEASHACEEAQDLLAPDSLPVGWMHWVQGHIHVHRQDLTTARTHFRTAATLFRSHNRLRAWDHTMSDLATLHHEAAELHTAVAILQELRAGVHSILQQQGITFVGEWV